MITILIPAYNEELIIERSIRTVHEYLESHQIAHEVIVVSNGSTDETVSICIALTETRSWLRVFSLPHRGVGSAFCLGVHEARSEWVLSLDADLSCELVFIDYAVELSVHADMIIGSKTLGRQKRSLFRVFGSSVYLAIANFAFDLTLSDYSLGSKAYRRDAILPALSHIDGWTNYVFELCLYLKMHNRRLLQVGVSCDDRRQSHFNLFHEGVYRFHALWRCWKKLRDKTSWFYTA